MATPSTSDSRIASYQTELKSLNEKYTENVKTIKNNKRNFIIAIITNIAIYALAIVSYMLSLPIILTKTLISLSTLSVLLTSFFAKKLYNSNRQIMASNETLKSKVEELNRKIDHERRNITDPIILPLIYNFFTN